MKKIALLLMLVSGEALGQNHAVPNSVASRSVSGIVKDTAGHVFLNAMVRLISENDTIVTAVNQGAFIFHNVKKSAFTLMVYSLEYRPWIKKISVDENIRNISIDSIILKRSGVIIHDITVDGTPSIIIK